MNINAIPCALLGASNVALFFITGLPINAFASGVCFDFAVAIQCVHKTRK